MRVRARGPAESGVDEMYRVMIVDDEKFVRKSIINRIEWEQRELFLAGEADNGADALELVGLVKPDIILVDIKMPIMNGIELIRKVKMGHPDIYFIILSGYDDFEYTKEAIKLGITNYIKKPIDENELNETLSLIVDLIRHQKENEEQFRDISRQIKKSKAIMHEKYLNNLLYRQYNLLSEEGMEFAYGNFSLLLAYIKQAPGAERAQGPAVEAVQQGVSDILKAIPDPRLDAYVFPNPLHPEEIRILLNGESLSGQAASIAVRLHNSLQKELCPAKARCISISVSADCNRTQSIPQIYLQCLDQLKRKILPGQPSVLQGADMVLADSVFSEFVYRSVNLLKEFMEKRDLQNVYRTLEKIFDGRNEKKFSVALLESIILEIHNTIKRSVVKLDIQIPGLSVNDLFQPDYLLKFGDLAELKQDLVSLLNQFLGLSRIEEGTLINRIRQYMHEHYAENLSLSKIAQEHYLNPSYLSQLFKSKTGENISRFLEDIRVEKARELLSSLSVSVVDVAFLVGYNDARYFSKVFKKNTGMLPSVYQERNNPDAVRKQTGRD